MTINPPTGAGLIAAERLRQITAEGWTPEHDDAHDEDHALAWAARCYIDAATITDDLWAEYPDFRPLNWPWEWEAYKPSRGSDRVRDLVKAGALIAAEIDRLLRAGTPTPNPPATGDHPRDQHTGNDVQQQSNEHVHTDTPKGDGPLPSEASTDRPNAHIGMQTPPTGGAA